ncbi:MBL fold metallo-hydrolase [candidate division KSB1 bacterium]|nr:MBL fold metallo-hydrolase [candidate division KSB1 bacterium]
MKKLSKSGKLFFVLFFCLIVSAAASGKDITMTILFDNYQHQEGLQAEWGFSCFVKGTEKTILFDTGSDGDVLKSNADKLGVDLGEIDAVVLSHLHQDHTGGLTPVMRVNPGDTVYMCQSFPLSLFDLVAENNLVPVSVKEPVKICRYVFSTGEVTGPVNEQGLVIDTEPGLVIIVGCSHPGIVKIVKKAKEITGKNVYLVFGGFHLPQTPEAEIANIINELKALDVTKCGATHCTGDKAIQMIRDAFGDNYVPMGVGKVLKVKARTVNSKKKKAESKL